MFDLRYCFYTDALRGRYPDMLDHSISAFSSILPRRSFHRPLIGTPISLH